MLTLRRARRPLAIVCIAVVALAVFAPGAAALIVAPPPLEYVLLPPSEPAIAVDTVPVIAAQPDALRSSLPERAPPSLLS